MFIWHRTFFFLLLLYNWLWSRLSWTMQKGGEEIDGKQNGLSTAVADLLHSNTTFHLVFIVSVLVPSAKSEPSSFITVCCFELFCHRVAFQLA